IVVGDNIFVKNALEDCAADGVDLRVLKIHLIVGGAYLPESLRRYLMATLHINADDPKTGTVYSSMGLSEFGLNVFFESQETVRLRWLASQHKDFCSKLLGSQAPYLPMMFNYLPQNTYLELVGETIILTNLSDKALLPLI